MKLALIALNALALAGAAAFFALAVVYDPRGSWGVSDGLKLALFLIPFFAAMVALRNGSTSRTRSFASCCSAAWAVLLVVLGLGASTGIGGAGGLLVVILPALVLLSSNWFVLRRSKGDGR